MELKTYLKFSYITGLKDVVLQELRQHFVLKLSHYGADSVYVDFTITLEEAKQMRSVSKAFLVVQHPKLNPLYIANHKSVIGNLIDQVLSKDKSFKSFKLICAGSDTPQVISINDYIKDSYNLSEQDNADLKIHIIKIEDFWEIGVQITPLPLSVRDYRVKNMRGAMDPTIAYAMNSFCELDQAQSYLNAFSGSGTLLIEAALVYPDLKKLVGFDNDKEHLSLSIRNMKKAKLIKRVQVKEADIFDKPDLGKFDVITADLPFGMLISKGENLTSLYKVFLEYCEQTLNENGVIAVYTSEYQSLVGLISKSKFKIINEVELKFMTASNAYLKPRIFVCKFN